MTLHIKFLTELNKKKVDIGTQVWWYQNKKSQSKEKYPAWTLKNYVWEKTKDMKKKNWDRNKKIGKSPEKKNSRKEQYFLKYPCLPSLKNKEVIYI